MSLQVAILKVLSGHPGGRASIAKLNSDLAFLNSIGAEWTERMKRLAARAPALDIFRQGLVTRDKAGWQLTASGYEFLAMIEAPDHPPQPSTLEPIVALPVVVQPAAAVVNVVHLDDHRRRRRRPQDIAPETAAIGPSADFDSARR